MRKKLLLIVFLLQAFIFNLTNVITPAYLSGLGLPKSSFGIFISLWSFGMLISSPAWGYLGDRYSRKKFVILGLIIYSLSQLVFYYSSNISVLYLMRIISGIGVGAPVTLLFTYLVKEVSINEKAKYLSLRMGFITLGATLSYLLGGYLGLVMIKELFLMQSLLTCLFILLVLFIVKRDSVKSCVYPKSYTLFSSIKYIRMLNTKLLLFYFSISLSMMAIINTDKFIDLYVIDQGYDSFVLGKLKMVFGLLTVIVNLFILPRFKKYLGNVFIMQSIQVVLGVIILVVFYDNHLIVLLYTIFLPFVVLKSFYQTSEQLFITNQVKNQEIGLHMGIRQSFVCFGMILGPLIGGYIYQINPQNLFTFNVVCLLVSSMILSYVRTDNFLCEDISLAN